MLETLIKPKYMVSISSRNMAPRGPNPNVTRTVAPLINQSSVCHMEKNVTGTTRKNISQSFAEAVNPLVVVA